MSDLIDRQAAIDAVHKNYDTILDFKSDGRTVADSFEDIINTLPTAQPEIIRCEKCEHYTALTGICEVRGKGLRLIRRPDDFCSRAERRSDE